jgi:hypothetical protein
VATRRRVTFRSPSPTREAVPAIKAGDITANDQEVKAMRSFLVLVFCLSVGGTSLAQTVSSEACLGLGPLAGQPIGVRWANSFTTFLDGHRADLSVDQLKLIQQAVQLGGSEHFSLKDPLSLNTMKAMMSSARQMLTEDQYYEILARMGAETQVSLREAAVVDDIACACTSGGSGCPSGFPCTVGCHTWGTGEWNGLCKAATVPAEQRASSDQAADHQQ